MATVTLTLYRKCKIEPDKNFILDDIEAYLSELQSITIENVQYQRFDLMKKIKLDMSQDFQTNSTDASIGNKYNYMKIETEVGEGNAVYYYFITGYEQTAQQTITLYIEMDTLNTFHFSETAANNTYTLNEKTSVKREHKDRLTITEKFVPWIISDPNVYDEDRINAWMTETWIGSSLANGSSNVEFDFNSFVERYQIATPVGMSFPLAISPNDVLMSVYIVDLEGRIVNSYNNYFNSNIEIYLNRVRIRTDLDVYNDIYYEQLNNSSFRLFFDVNYFGNSGTPTSFTPAGTWNFIKDFIITDKVLRQAPLEELVTYFRREIDEYNEGIETKLFKKSETTLYDEDGGNQWYMTYISANDIGSGTTASDQKIVNPVCVEFWSDDGYSVSNLSQADISIYANDRRFKDYQNDEEWIGVFVGGTITGSLEAPTGPNEKNVRIGNYTIDLYTLLQEEKSYWDHSFFNIPVDWDPSQITCCIFARRKYASSTEFNKIDVYSTIPQRGYYGTSTLIEHHKILQDGAFPTMILHNLSKIYEYSDSNSPSQGDIYDTTHRVYDLYSTDSGENGTCPAFDTRDLSDPKLLKCFAFPYCPIGDFVGKEEILNIPNEFSFNITDNAIQLIKTQSIDLTSNKTINVPSPLKELGFNAIMSNFKEQSRNKIWESKLFHSDYYQPKFVYDSFAYPFNLETMDAENVLSSYPKLSEQFNFSYTVSKNILSKFMFTFDECNYKLSNQDYDSILLVNRNNEKALYNNAYINYIRSGGFANDATKNQEQTTINGITSGVTLAASIGTLVAGIAATASGYGAPMGVGAIVGGIAGIAGAGANVAKTVISSQQQDRDLAQKLTQLQMQGTNVVGNEDIDLLKEFSDNKPKLVYYSLSDRMENAMWDLFHYCGYATNEQKVPQTNTRLYFNFIQADIVYEDYTFNEEVAQDIQEKWAQGVTFLHKVDGEYDIDQEYENFEVSLL